MAKKHDTSIEEGVRSTTHRESSSLFGCPESVITISQKLIAEVVGTYFIIFAGCGSVVVNKSYDGVVTFPGICVTWGLIVMVMIYSIGHISGSHFNPAVTITFAIFQGFPSCQVPLYIASQVMGSVLASGTLALLFEITPKQYFGTVPTGSNLQSLVMEIIISFLLMFVIQGISTDKRANAKLGGIVVGMTIVLNVFVAGPVSGASMNPARSAGPAVILREYDALWVYCAGPTAGMLLGAFVYKMIRGNDQN